MLAVGSVASQSGGGEAGLTLQGAARSAPRPTALLLVRLLVTSRGLLRTHYYWRILRDVTEAFRTPCPVFKIFVSQGPWSYFLQHRKTHCRFCVLIPAVITRNYSVKSGCGELGGGET